MKKYQTMQLLHSQSLSYEELFILSMVFVFGSIVKGSGIEIKVNLTVHLERARHPSTLYPLDVAADVVHGVVHGVGSEIIVARARQKFENCCAPDELSNLELYEASS